MAHDTDTWTTVQLESEKQSAKEGGFLLSDEAAAVMSVARQLMYINVALDEILRVVEKQNRSS